MIEQLTTIERQRALVLLLVVTLGGLVLLIAGKDDALGIHGALIMLVSIAAIFYLIAGYFAPEPTDEPPGQLLRRAEQGRHPARHDLGRRRPVRRRLGGLAARLSQPQLRGRLDELRPAASGAHDQRHLRLRRQRADRHVLLRHAAHLAGAHSRPAQPAVRALRLQPVLPARRHRLHDGRHPVEGVRRARVVRRPLAGRRLGDLLRRLPAHADAAQGAAHLRRQLVLPGVRPGRGDAAHRQQPRRPGRASAAPRATRSSPACRMR